MSNAYNQARHLAEKQVHKARQSGRFPFLPALEYMLPRGEFINEEHVGIMEIPLAQITGTMTEGRQDSFSYGFMPFLPGNSEFAAKWSALYDAQQTEGIRDAIKVYEYLRRFYVLEGHKRVSVMKYLGAELIEADIIRVLPEDLESPVYAQYREFLEFFKAARIYALSFTEPGGYVRLAKALGQDLTHPWSPDFCRDLRGAYFYFSEVYTSKGGDRLPISSGDAFLDFLERYSLEELWKMGKDELGKKIAEMLSLLTAGEGRISLMDLTMEGGSRFMSWWGILQRWRRKS